MVDPSIAPNTPRFEVRVTADSHFAWIRTRLAVVRTMMAWVRTSVALIGFGFVIVQFFEHLQQAPEVLPADFPSAPKYLGLALIACGDLALIISIWQYWWTDRYLRSGSFTPISGVRKERMRSPVVVIAVVLSLIGAFAFSAVLLRLV